MNDNTKEVKIMNLKQVIAYSQNGIQPKRVDAGYNGKAVFIYDRDATQEIFHKWVHRELTVEFLKWYKIHIATNILVCMCIMDIHITNTK